MGPTLKPFSQPELGTIHVFFPPHCAYSYSTAARRSYPSSPTTKMDLEFVDHDLLNSRLVDVRSGRVHFKISTRASYGKGNEDGVVIVLSRHTAISDSDGIIAEIDWTGEEKKSGGQVRILDEEAMNFTHLFSGHTTLPDR